MKTHHFLVLQYILWSGVEVGVDGLQSTHVLGVARDGVVESRYRGENSQ